MIKKNPKMFCSVLMPVVFRRLYGSYPPTPVAQVVLKRFGAPSTTRSVAGDSRVADSEDSNSQGVHYGTPWSQGLALSPRTRDKTFTWVLKTAEVGEEGQGGWREAGNSAQ